MKMPIKNVLDNLDQDNIEGPQFRWEYFKYHIRKCSIHFQKILGEIRKLKEHTWKIN